MEPLAAFGLAANVLEVVNFSLETASICRQIYEKGATDVNVDIEKCSNRLAQFTNTLSVSIRQGNSPKSLTVGQQNLCDTAEDCKEIITDLQHELSKLKPKNGSTRIEVLLKTAKAVTRKRAIEQLHTRLRDCQGNLQTLFLAEESVKNEALALSQQISLENLQEGVREIIIHTANGQTQQLIDHISNENQDIKVLLSTQHADLTSQIENLSLQSPSSEKQKQHDHLLASLKFPELNQRRNQVYSSDRHVFDWIWEEEGEHVWSSFPKWLETNDSIFWISGKPGSGKSSLMKYILGHPNTEEFLKLWQHNRQPLIVAHFFWLAGTTEQRNEHGLLCSLLYQLLAGDAALASGLLTNMPILHKDTHHDWAVGELTEAIAICFQATARPCLILLDGLDEFDARQGPSVLLRLVKLWSNTAKVKLCVSSRPEVIFQKFFEPYSKLRLQDLTESGMRLVATRTFDENVGAQLSDTISDRHMKAIIDLILNKAQGVFLWVHLAVKSIARGIDAGDDWEDMLDRISVLPSDMRSLYASMWSRLNDDSDLFRKEAARYFKLLITRNEYVVFGSLNLLQVTIAENQTLSDRILNEVVEIDEQDILKFCSKTKLRIQTRCAGLLEIVYSKAQPQGAENNKHEVEGEQSTFGATIEGVKANWKVVIDENLHFIHRTAQEFLTETLDGQNILSLHNSTEIGDLYNLSQAQIARCYLLYVRGKEAIEDDMPILFEEIIFLLRQLLFCCSTLETSVIDKQSSGQNWLSWMERLIILDSTYSKLVHHTRYLPRVTEVYPDQRPSVFSTLLGQASVEGYINIVQHFLDRAQPELRRNQRLMNHLLHCACASIRRDLPHYQKESLVVWLLDRGAQATVADMTQDFRCYPLTAFTNSMLQKIESSPRDRHLHGEEIAAAQKLIEHGADLRGTVIVGCVRLISSVELEKLLCFAQDTENVYLPQTVSEEGMLIVQATLASLIDVLLPGVKVGADSGTSEAPEVFGPITYVVDQWDKSRALWRRYTITSGIRDDLFGKFSSIVSNDTYENRRMAFWQLKSVVMQSTPEEIRKTPQASDDPGPLFYGRQAYQNFPFQ